MNLWEKMAHLVQVNYGGYVDWEERFFNCPECGEPIYETDWMNEDMVNGFNDYICPVCESIID